MALQGHSPVITIIRGYFPFLVFTRDFLLPLSHSVVCGAPTCASRVQRHLMLLVNASRFLEISSTIVRTGETRATSQRCATIRFPSAYLTLLARQAQADEGALTSPTRPPAPPSWHAGRVPLRFCQRARLGHWAPTMGRAEADWLALRLRPTRIQRRHLASANCTVYRRACVRILD